MPVFLFCPDQTVLNTLLQFQPLPNYFKPLQRESFENERMFSGNSNVEGATTKPEGFRAS